MDWHQPPLKCQRGVRKPQKLQEQDHNKAAAAAAAAAAAVWDMQQQQFQNLQWAANAAAWDMTAKGQQWAANAMGSNGQQMTAGSLVEAAEPKSRNVGVQTENDWLHVEEQQIRKVLTGTFVYSETRKVFLPAPEK